MTKRIPYTYLIGWSNLDKWYYGVRYSKKANPEDLWKTYFTSSKIVKEFIEANGNPDIIEIRKTFNSHIKAKNYEDKVLRRLKVNKSDKWLNIKADSFKGLDVDKVTKLLGANNPIHKYLSNEENRKSFSEKISIGVKIGQAKSEKAQLAKLANIERFKNNNPGKNKSKETKRKISEAKKGKPTKLKEILKNNPELRVRGNKHPNYGRDMFNERSEEWQINARKNISEKRLSELYYCKDCDRIIKTTANWYKHLRSNKHNLTDDIIKTQYMHSSITEDIINRIEENKNIKKVRLIETYYCSDCDKTIRTIGNWYKHLKSKIHNKTDDEIKTLCMDCRM